MAKKFSDIKWTDEEIQILYNLGKDKTAKELSVLIPNHSVTAIRAKIGKLKIKPDKGWSDEELNILKNNCNSPDLLKSLLPNRTWKSILKTRERYGFGDKFKNIVPWTEEEIKVLEAKSSDLFSTELAELIPNHTAKGIARKSFKLKIEKSKECKTRIRSLGGKNTNTKSNENTI